MRYGQRKSALRIPRSALMVCRMPAQLPTECRDAQSFFAQLYSLIGARRACERTLQLLRLRRPRRVSAVPVLDEFTRLATRIHDTASKTETMEARTISNANESAVMKGGRSMRLRRSEHPPTVRRCSSARDQHALKAGRFSWKAGTMVLQQS